MKVTPERGTVPEAMACSEGPGRASGAPVRGCRSPRTTPNPGGRRELPGIPGSVSEGTENRITVGPQTATSSRCRTTTSGAHLPRTPHCDGHRPAGLLISGIDNEVPSARRRRSTSAWRHAGRRQSSKLKPVALRLRLRLPPILISRWRLFALLTAAPRPRMCSRRSPLTAYVTDTVGPAARIGGRSRRGWARWNARRCPGGGAAGGDDAGGYRGVPYPRCRGLAPGAAVGEVDDGCCGGGTTGGMRPRSAGAGGAI